MGIVVADWVVVQMGIGRMGCERRPWRIGAAAVALLALLLAACGGNGASGGGGGSSTSGDYSALERRPFHAPTLDASGGCPVSTQRQVSPDTSGTGGTLPAVGDGPAYVTGQALVVIGVALAGGGGSHGGKTPPPHTSSAVRQVWLIAPYNGPILVRARRIDGDGAVRFGVGQNGVGGTSELRLAGGGNHWISSSTDFVADSAGCYAFQVDGNGFSYPVVFLFIYTRD
jgi:hypothetical protein